MKRLYVLLSYVICLSSDFAAVVSPSTEFDDCDETITPRDKGCVEPHTTPQAGPQFGQGLDSLMQLFLPMTTEAPLTDAEAPTEAPKNTSEPEGEVVPSDVSLKPAAEDTNRAILRFPELKIYYTERDGDETSLKRFTTEVLTEDYAALNSGDVLEVMFIPEVGLNNVLDTSADQSVRNISIFDTIGWIANLRAWAKWWLNPWSWWNPSLYSLDNNDSVEWDSVASNAIVSVTAAKDFTYLTSQLRLFLLSDWTSEDAPYIVPRTQTILERAVMLRFENVEKPALEAVGFKNVILGTRVNSVKHSLERSIQATK